MLTRVSVRGVIRVLAAGLLAACPLVAADPPAPTVIVVPAARAVGPVVRAGYTAPQLAVEIPPVPLGQYPALYSGFDWMRLSEQLATAKRRNAERVPFDLKYLPPVDPESQGPNVIVAVRPTAIFDRPGGQRLVAEWLVDTGILDLAKSFLGLSALKWPAVHEVDMIAARGILEAKVTDDGKSFILGANHAHGAVIRTRERYDWRRELASVQPALGTATYRGVEYRTTKVNIKTIFSQWPGDEPATTGIYVADDYTIVIDTEEAIERLIDRLLDAKPPEVPPGWEKVSRGVVAVAMTCPNKGWTRDLPGFRGPRLPKGGDWEWSFLDDLHELLIGLDDQPTTRFQLTASAFDPFAGKRMTWNAKQLFALLAAYLVDMKGPEGDEARAIWEKATFTPTHRGFQITANTGKDLLNPLLDKYAAEAKPAVHAVPELPPFYPAVSPTGQFRFLPGELPPPSPNPLKPWEITIGDAAFPSGVQLLPPLGLTQAPPSPTAGGNSEKNESDLPPIPQTPPSPGFYDRSPLGGLSGIGERPK